MAKDKRPFRDDPKRLAIVNSQLFKDRARRQSNWLTSDRVPDGLRFVMVRNEGLLLIEQLSGGKLRALIWILGHWFSGFKIHWTVALKMFWHMKIMRRTSDQVDEIFEAD